MSEENEYPLSRPKRTWKPVFHSNREIQAVLNEIWNAFNENLTSFLVGLKKIVEEVVKPCILLNICPYGSLIEFFPIFPRHDHPFVKFDVPEYMFRARCTKTGHLCPVYVMGTVYEKE